MNIYFIAGVLSSVCVFYTFVGGIKAVVHTDAWQIFVMFVSVIVVTVLGTIANGGVFKVFETASNGGRIEFFKLVNSLRAVDNKK